MIRRTIEQLGPTVIFHCAAQGVSYPFLPPDEAIRANVYGTINVYAASKAAAWQFCRMCRRTEGWPIIGAMLFQVYGPGQSAKNVVPAAIEAALAARDFPLTSGRSQRDWIYIDDVIDALIEWRRPIGLTQNRSRLALAA